MGGKAERIVLLLLEAATNASMALTQLNTPAATVPNAAADDDDDAAAVGDSGDWGVEEGMGSSPLHVAVSFAVAVEREVLARRVRLLEEEGIDVRKKEIEWEEEEKWMRKEAEGMVRLLLERGADVQARRGRDGLSALQIACGGDGPVKEREKSSRSDTSSFPSSSHPSSSVSVPATREVIRSLLQAGAAPNATALPLSTSFQNAGGGSSRSSSSSSGAAATVRPLEYLLTSRFFEGEEGGKEGRVEVLTEGVEDDYARRLLLARLPLVVEVVRYGGRMSIKKLKSVGVDPALIAVIESARREWEGKAVPGVEVKYRGHIAGKEKGGEEGGRDGGWTLTSSVGSTSGISRGGMGVGHALNSLLVGGGGGSNGSSNSMVCPLCSTYFTFLFRRQCCQACGVEICTYCSSKRLSVLPPASSSSFSSPSSSTPPVLERACDVCFTLAHTKAATRAALPSSSHSHPSPMVLPPLPSQPSPADEFYGRNKRELCLNGRREARRKGGREGGAAGSTHPETRPGVVPTEQPSTQVTEAAAQAQSMMDENMILMQVRRHSFLFFLLRFYPPNIPTTYARFEVAAAF